MGKCVFAGFRLTLSKFRDQNVIETWAWAISVFYESKHSLKIIQFILQNEGIVIIPEVFSRLG